MSARCAEAAAPDESVSALLNGLTTPEMADASNQR